MADIFHLQVTPDERELCRQQAAFLLQVLIHKRFTKSNVERIFHDWLSVARRLRDGGQMVDEALVNARGNESAEAHFRSLADLYYLLSRMCWLFDQFFQVAFPPEDEARYARAQALVGQVREVWMAA